MKEWCPHIKGSYSADGTWRYYLYNGLVSTYDDMAFCPWCGKPKPKEPDEREVLRDILWAICDTHENDNRRMDLILEKFELRRPGNG